MTFRPHPCFVVMLFVAATMALLGCGGGDPLGRQAISGRVTLDDAPIERGAIEFLPLELKGVGSGALIAEGKYEVPQEKGPPLGKYKVVISATAAPPPSSTAAAPTDEIDQPSEELLPSRYNSQTELRIELLADGPRTFDFDLTSTP